MRICVCVYPSTSVKIYFRSLLNSHIYAIWHFIHGNPESTRITICPEEKRKASSLEDPLSKADRKPGLSVKFPVRGICLSFCQDGWSTSALFHVANRMGTQLAGNRFMEPWNTGGPGALQVSERSSKWWLPLWSRTHLHTCAVDAKSYQMSAFLQAGRQGKSLTPGGAWENLKNGLKQFLLPEITFSLWWQLFSPRGLVWVWDSWCQGSGLKPECRGHLSSERGHKMGCI